MSDAARYRRTFKFLLPLVKPAMKLIFNYEYESLKDIEGPYLLLPNHNLELDPIVVGIAAGRQIFFVSSEHIMRKGLGTWFLMRYFKPIIHQKGRKGVATTKELLKTLRGGDSVCLFPEGNRSFNGLTGYIAPATGRMAKRSGAKLVTYKFEGGYLSQPRWSMSLRKGKLKGRIVNIYTPEQLSAMTDDEVNEAICHDLYEDAYATQARDMIPFKGKKLALGMESTLFTCPECGSIGSLRSDKKGISCGCGYRAEYDVYGYLITADGEKHTITEYDALQRELLKKRLLDHPIDEPLFSDDVTLYDIGEDHELISATEGRLTAYKDHLECCGVTMSFDDMLGLALVSRNFIIINTSSDEKHYEIKGINKKEFSALKYLYTFEIAKGIE